MYRNSNGDQIQARLKASLQEGGARVVNDFDLRDAHCRDGRVFTADGFDLSELDLLFHMNADEQTPYQMNLLRAVERSGIEIVNSYAAFDLASDKFAANQVLRRAGILVAPSLLVSAKTDPALVRSVVETWGTPVVVKSRFSFGGKGVMRLDGADALLDFIQITKGDPIDYYVERFMPFADRDYRVEVIDGECIGSYSRGLVAGYKTNMSACPDLKKARFLTLKPRPDLNELALRAARAIGLSATIVDMVQSAEDGRYVMLEVNCMLGIFVEAANEVYGIVPREADAYEYASDARKLRALSAFLLRRASEARRARPGGRDA
jgi:ribosomal protein S6--L-glutamate ligase